MSRPESIENRWDILYHDYPEVYEDMSSVTYRPTIYEKINQVINLQGKTIADIGSGTGSSSIGLSKYARQVIGIEREPSMLKQAQKKMQIENWKRLFFLSGDALAIPLSNNSVDLVTGITLALYPPKHYREFIKEGLRVAKGSLVYVGIPPLWYGGELYEIIENEYKDKVDVEIDRIFLEDYNFAYQDIISEQDYGTVDHIVNVIGFIFGKKVINYLQKERKTTLKWKFRIYWRE